MRVVVLTTGGEYGRWVVDGLAERDVRPEEPADSPFADRLRQYQQLVLAQRGLPELLRYEDRNSMAHSLEARVPFLDHRLVELASRSTAPSCSAAA